MSICIIGFVYEMKRGWISITSFNFINLINFIKIDEQMHSDPVEFMQPIFFNLPQGLKSVFYKIEKVKDIYSSCTSLFFFIIRIP